MVEEAERGVADAVLTENRVRGFPHPFDLHAAAHPVKRARLGGHARKIIDTGFGIR